MFDEPYNSSVDVFSFGMVLLEVLAHIFLCTRMSTVWFSSCHRIVAYEESADWHRRVCGQEASEQVWLHS